MADNKPAEDKNKKDKKKDDEESEEEEKGCCTKCCEGYEACIVACCKVSRLSIN